MAITAFRFGTAFSPLDYAPAIRIGNKHRIFISEYADYSYVVNSTIQKNGASDPANDTTTTPAGTYPGSGAFVGGVLLPDGRVFCVPYNSSTARIYNPVNDTVTTPAGTYPGSGAFYGGVLLPDGRVFCVPRNSTTARIYNPVNDTVTTPAGTYPGSGAFNGGVLLPDGRVFCVPPNSTSARMCSGDFSGASKNFQLLAVLSPYLNKF